MFGGNFEFTSSKGGEECMQCGYPIATMEFDGL
jgi:hypothetical protein